MFLRGVKKIWKVSILVLVDLAHESVFLALSNNPILRFNPCFSGSCSRIGLRGKLPSGKCAVSILVLVDLAHECQPYRVIYPKKCVSILVLVDLAHEFWHFGQTSVEKICFNPCFSGSCSRIDIPTIRLPNTIGVSILVLVDLAHESYQAGWTGMLNVVSILVLVDLAHE